MPTHPTRFATVTTLLLLGCPTETSPVSATESAHPTSKVVSSFEPVAYEASLRKIEERRRGYADRYREADAGTRRKVRKQARAFMVDAISGTIFPAWMGTPWGLGKNSTAQRPFEKGKVVGCSYFVTSVLENAGMRLSNRYRFAQAPALDIQRSLAPKKRDLHRYFSIAPSELARKVERLGDGLYIIGLNNHVGFVVVRDGVAHVVHASYTDEKVVTRELVSEAKVIKNSQKAGYFVSSLFEDERLVEKWILGEEVAFVGP